MDFLEVKESLLKEIETEKIDERMRPWVDKFNSIPEVCTTFCCQGHTGDEILEEEKKAIEEMRVEGYRVELSEFSPYISFIVNSNKIEKELCMIDGLKFDIDNDFHVDIGTHWQNNYIEYSFYFPYEFDEFIKKVYNKCISWLEKYFL